MDEWVDDSACEIRNVILQPDFITIKLQKGKLVVNCTYDLTFFRFSHSYFKIISVHKVFQSERGWGEIL